jgi:hypothetical protein
MPFVLERLGNITPDGSVMYYENEEGEDITSNFFFYPDITLKEGNILISFNEGGGEYSVLKIGGFSDNTHPNSRKDYLLTELAASAGGGSTNYNDLTNKPSINNTTLTGNKTAGDLGLVLESELAIEAENRIDGDDALQQAIDEKLDDAPSDGFTYSRRNAAWEPVDTLLDKFLSVAIITGPAQIPSSADGTVEYNHYQISSWTDPNPTLTIAHTSTSTRYDTNLTMAVISTSSTYTPQPTPNFVLKWSRLGWVVKMCTGFFYRDVVTRSASCAFYLPAGAPNPSNACEISVASSTADMRLVKLMGMNANMSIGATGTSAQNMQFRFLNNGI